MNAPYEMFLCLTKCSFADMLTEGLQQAMLGYNAEGSDHSSFCEIEEIGLKQASQKSAWTKWRMQNIRSFS